MGTERMDAAGSWRNFDLPANSRGLRGRVWPAPPGAEPVKEFRVYRYDPQSGQGPRLGTYFVDLDDCGPMVLDALIAIRIGSTAA